MSGPKFTGTVAKYPARFALGAYVALIAAGAGLLSLPVCHTNGARPLTFLDALFTATSAVCVTGLSVRSTGHDLSLVGQVVLLMLVQLGGIGIITVTTLLTFGARKGPGTRHRLAISEALGSRPTDDARWVVRTVIWTVLGIEGLGFLVLLARNLTDMGMAPAAWHALFHAVSAFCNAGFSLYDDNLVRYRTDAVVNLTVCGLIITGGIGFPVWLEVSRAIRSQGWRWSRDLSLHTRLVLLGTAGLLVFGTVSFLVLEQDNALAGLSWYEQVLPAFFHSTTCRTAGFNTVEVARLTNATLFISILLMMIGAAPCSTGGGFKVSTMMVLGVLSRDKLRGYDTARVARRTIPEQIIDRSIAAVLLFTLIIVVGLTVLLAMEDAVRPDHISHRRFLSCLFEIVSALGTVGLSMGLTTELGDGGRILLIVLMFIGRLGPISLFIAVSRTRRDTRLEYAKEDVLIG